MICPHCQRETQPGLFCHACDVYLTNTSLGFNAGVASRLAALGLDFVVGWVIFFVIGMSSCVMATAGGALGNVGARDQAAGPLLGVGTWFGSFVLGFIGYTVFALWFLAQGKTPGKWLVGIRVVDKRDGQNPGLGRMLVREVIGKFASGLFFGLGYFWAIWDPDHQCWHDKIAGTLVLRSNAIGAPAGVPAALPERPGTSARRTVPDVPVKPPLRPDPGHGAGSLERFFCPDCGSQLPAGSRYCETCGAAVALS